MNRKNRKKKLTKGEFLEKHKPIPKGKEKEAVEQSRKVKRIYAKEMGDIEKNLRNYYDSLISVFDPRTGHEIARLRRPSVDELDMLSPPYELMKLKGLKEDDLAKIPDEKRERIKHEGEVYVDNQFKVLESIIVTPKKTAKEWRKFPPEFLAMIQEAVLEDVAKLGKQVENFQ